MEPNYHAPYFNCLTYSNARLNFSQEKLNFPHPVNIPDLPTLDWAKYTSVYGTFDHVFSNDTASPKKPVTRKKKINFETGVPRLSLVCTVLSLSVVCRITKMFCYRMTTYGAEIPTVGF